MRPVKIKMDTGTFMNNSISVNPNCPPRILLVTRLHKTCVCFMLNAQPATISRAGGSSELFEFFLNSQQERLRCSVLFGIRGRGVPGQLCPMPARGLLAPACARSLRLQVLQPHVSKHAARATSSTQRPPDPCFIAHLIYISGLNTARSNSMSTSITYRRLIFAQSKIPISTFYSFLVVWLL